MHVGIGGGNKVILCLNMLNFRVSCVFEMQVMSCSSCFTELNEGPKFVLWRLLQSQRWQRGIKLFVWESNISGELKEFWQVVR